MTHSISPALRDTDTTFVTDWFFLSGDFIALIFVGPEDEQLKKQHYALCRDPAQLSFQKTNVHL